MSEKEEQPAKAEAIAVQEAAPAKNNMMAMLAGFLGLTTIAFMAATIVLAVQDDSSSASSSASGAPAAVVGYGVALAKPPTGVNQCVGTKPDDNPYFDNVACMVDGVVTALEQAGANVTVGYKGEIDASTREPITTPFFEAGLCPVNVHWHLGAEHTSAGQFDESGSGPSEIEHRRKLAGKVRKGFQCSLFDAEDSKFTEHYDWKHCEGMEVGQTYEVHWPHSAAGACGTLNQYQTPFYDHRPA
jgi:hypothetical protein